MKIPVQLRSRARNTLLDAGEFKTTDATEEAEDPPRFRLKNRFS
jgi:hypothetical protein